MTSFIIINRGSSRGSYSSSRSMYSGSRSRGRGRGSRSRGRSRTRGSRSRGRGRPISGRGRGRKQTPRFYTRSGKPNVMAGSYNAIHNNKLPKNATPAQMIQFYYFGGYCYHCDYKGHRAIHCKQIPLDIKRILTSKAKMVNAIAQDLNVSHENATKHVTKMMDLIGENGRTKTSRQMINVINGMNGNEKVKEKLLSKNEINFNNNNNNDNKNNNSSIIGAVQLSNGGSNINNTTPHSQRILKQSQHGQHQRHVFIDNGNGKKNGKHGKGGKRKGNGNNNNTSS